MKRTMGILSLLAAFTLFCAAQPQSSSPSQITNGPGVDNITASSAEVFWNTSAPSGATVRYGTDEDKLTETAQAPAAQTDHKVVLKNLQPGTTYFFQVVTAGAGSYSPAAKSGIGTFKTKSKGGQDEQKY